MIFKGELSRFHPADILMFLSHLGSNGILSIIHTAETLTFSFKDGMMIDARSRRGDDKTISMLFYNKFIDAQQLNRLKNLKRETGLSVRQILEELKLQVSPPIHDIFAAAIKEVTLEFFLMENGEFHFTDVSVDMGSTVKAFDCRSISLEIVTHADEWRDIEKNMFSLESRICPATEISQQLKLSNLEKTILGVAAKSPTARKVVQLVPFYSYEVLKAIENLLSQKLLILQPSKEPQAQMVTEGCEDRLFFNFKRAFKTIVTTTDIRKKLSAVVAFCKAYFDQIVILTANGTEILQLTVAKMEKKDRILQKNIKHPNLRLDEDPGFYAVYRSGTAFIGKTYNSNILKGIVDFSAAGECAIIPIGKQNNVHIMLYAVTCSDQKGLSAFHYLELLSWLTGFSAADQAPLEHRSSSSEQSEGADVVSQKSHASQSGVKKINVMIDKIDELPPLPLLATKILELLGDPEFSMDKLEELISQDQSFVAKLIKVSNSALYGGIGDIGSLRQAVARLGTRSVKSLILTNSTRTFFPQKQSGIGIWSQLLWQHSVECGLASRCVAQKVGYGDTDEAFVGGVLHDIGKLVMLIKFPEEYRRIQKMKQSGSLNGLTAELDVLGCDHTVVGERLMNKWKMPDKLRACVHLHHRFRETDDNDLLVSVVAYGNHLSKIFSDHTSINPAESTDDTDSLVARLKLTEAQNKALKDEVIQDLQNSNLFD